MPTNPTDPPADADPVETFRWESGLPAALEEMQRQHEAQIAEILGEADGPEPDAIVGPAT